MKVTEIIRAALTRLGIYATGEEVPADDALAALDVLNGILSEFKLQPLLGVPDTLVLPLDINDEPVLPDNLERLIVLTLAMDLAPDYGVEPSATLVNRRNGAMTVLKQSNAKPIFTKSAWKHNRYGCY